MQAADACLVVGGAFGLCDTYRPDRLAAGSWQDFDEMSTSGFLLRESWLAAALQTGVCTV